jgi:hypothetical protein
LSDGVLYLFLVIWLGVLSKGKENPGIMGRIGGRGRGGNGKREGNTLIVERAI